MADKKSNYEKVSRGDKWSMAAFGTVVRVNHNGISVEGDDGQEFNVEGVDLVESQFQFHNQHDEVRNVTKTEIADIFLSHARVVMTVVFRKQVKPNDIVKHTKQLISQNTKKELPVVLADYLTDALKGEERVMIGRHYGNPDDVGRVRFIDMEVEQDKSKDYDNRLRQVDPRTITEIIAAGVQYSIK